MTSKTIKDLFYGNLNLFDRPMVKNVEYVVTLLSKGDNMIKSSGRLRLTISCVYI